MDNIKQLAANYESAALAACTDAAQEGKDAPRLLSVHATAEGYELDFLAPRQTFTEVRKAIISKGGAYRVAFV